MRTLLLSMLGLALLANSGCSTLSIDKARVNQTQKVAVLGFCVRQEVPPTLLGKLLNVEEDKSGPGAGFAAETCSDKAHASVMYKDFTGSFKPEFNFSVLDLKTVAENPAYKALHKKSTEGWQSRPPSHGSKYECYRAEGILDPFPVRNLSMEERKSLMASLGVDRIALVEVQTNVDNTNFLKGLVGAADLSTEATVHFSMYTADDESPIWSDTNAKGEGSKGTVGSVLGFSDQQKLDLQTVEVSRSAYKKLKVRARE